MYLYIYINSMTHTHINNMRTCIKTYVQHLNRKLYYQQLHLKYMCNLASSLRMTR